MDYKVGIEEKASINLNAFNSNLLADECKQSRIIKSHLFRENDLTAIKTPDEG